MSSTPQTQIKINLPIAIKKSFKKKARKFGVTMSFYIKHLMIKELEEDLLPSDATLRAYKQAKKYEKEGKLIRVSNTNEYFKSLK